MAGMRKTTSFSDVVFIIDLAAALLAMHVTFLRKIELLLQVVQYSSKFIFYSRNVSCLVADILLVADLFRCF